MRLLTVLFIALALPPLSTAVFQCTTEKTMLGYAEPRQDAHNCNATQSTEYCAVIFYDNNTVHRYCPSKTECANATCADTQPAGKKCCCKGPLCNGGDRASFNLTTPAAAAVAVALPAAIEAPTTAAAPKNSTASGNGPANASGLHSGDELEQLEKKLELEPGQRLDGSSVAYDPNYMSTYAKVYTFGALFWIFFIGIMQTILMFARDPREAPEDRNNESARMLLRHHETNKNSSSNREVDHTQTATEEPSRKTERTQEH